jgi:hypothetical protein
MFLKIFTIVKPLKKNLKILEVAPAGGFKRRPRQPQVKGVIDLLQTTSCRK